MVVRWQGRQGQIAEHLMNRAFLIGLILLATAQASGTQGPRTHDLTLTPEHVHWGYYDSRVAPVLRIASGDRVRVETMVAGGLQRGRLGGGGGGEAPGAAGGSERVGDPGIAQGRRAACDRTRARRAPHDWADLHRRG